MILLLHFRTKGISGKEVTPYVLERVNQLSGGSSLAANVALIHNNARVGARIAVQYQRLMARRTNLLTNIGTHSRPAIGLHSHQNGPEITNGDNHSSELSKTCIQSMPESIRRELIERNAQSNRSEELSPVRPNRIIRSIV